MTSIVMQASSVPTYMFHIIVWDPTAVQKLYGLLVSSLSALSLSSAASSFTLTGQSEVPERSTSVTA